MVSIGQSYIKTAAKSLRVKPRPRKDKDGQRLLHIMCKVLSRWQLAEEGAGEREQQPAERSSSSSPGSVQVLDHCN